MIQSLKWEKLNQKPKENLSISVQPTNLSDVPHQHQELIAKKNNEKDPVQEFIIGSGVSQPKTSIKNQITSILSRITFLNPYPARI